MYTQEDMIEDGQSDYNYHIQNILNETYEGTYSGPFDLKSAEILSPFFRNNIQFKRGDIYSILVDKEFPERVEVLSKNNNVITHLDKGDENVIWKFYN